MGHLVPFGNGQHFAIRAHRYDSWAHFLSESQELLLLVHIVVDGYNTGNWVNYFVFGREMDVALDVGSQAKHNLW